MEGSSHRVLVASAPPHVLPEELQGFSEVGELQLEHSSWIPRVAVIAADPWSRATPAPRPTILAISGENQRHVSMFFKAFRAELRGWQVLIPLRPQGEHQPFFFEEAGLKHLERLVTDLVASRGGPAALLPAPVEGGRVHLVGTSNGGASVLALACRAPRLVASLTCVTGFDAGVETGGKGLDLSPLQQIPLIRFWAGELDELGHQRALAEIHHFGERGRRAGPQARLAASVGPLGLTSPCVEPVRALPRSHACLGLATLIKSREATAAKTKELRKSPFMGHEEGEESPRSKEPSHARRLFLSALSLSLSLAP